MKITAYYDHPGSFLPLTLVSKPTTVYRDALEPSPLSNQPLLEQQLRAGMECAALFSPSVMQSQRTSSGYGFGERRVRPLCHLIVRQQTWQENINPH
jgi:hypothetical protein